MQALRSTQVCGVSDRLQKCPDVVTGRPDVDVNMGDLKPTWLAVGIAVVALSQCLPVGGSKTFGSYAINSPFKAVAKVGTLVTEHPTPLAVQRPARLGSTHSMCCLGKVST